MKTEVTKVEDEKNVVILKVEVPADKVMPTIDKAYKEVSQKVKIPGFRKGKIPPQIIDQMIGQDAVMNEAINDLIPIFYPEAIESSGLEPVSQPKVDIEQIEKDKPFIFTARVELKPEVKLGDYSLIELPKKSTKATKKEIDDHLNKTRGRFAQLEPVSRAIKNGDYVLLDFEGFTDGKPFENGSASDQMLEIGSQSLIPGFEEKLIGAKKGQELDIEITFPEDYHVENMAGKDAVFHIVIKEVKNKKLPKLDDDFAKNVSKFDTLEELKADIKNDIDERKKKEAESATKDGAVDFVTEQAEVDLPKGMVDQQVNAMIKDFEQILQREKKTLPDYLNEQGDTFNNFMESFRPEAEKRIKTNLVLEAAMNAENIEVTDEELDKEIRRLADNAEKSVEELKTDLTEDHYNYLRSQLKLIKTVDLFASKVKLIKEEDYLKKAKEEHVKKLKEAEKSGKKEEEEKEGIEAAAEEEPEAVETFAGVQFVPPEQLEEGDDKE